MAKRRISAESQNQRGRRKGCVYALRAACVWIARSRIRASLPAGAARRHGDGRGERAVKLGRARSTLRQLLPPVHLGFTGHGTSRLAWRGVARDSTGHETVLGNGRRSRFRVRSTLHQKGRGCCKSRLSDEDLQQSLSVSDIRTHE